jgi:O-antigen/teichoic acid export membrane protein
MGAAAAGFLDFGTNSYWARELATRRMEVGELGQRMAAKLAVAGVLSILWVLAFLCLFPTKYLWVAAAVGFSTVLNQSSQVGLRGIARGDLVSVSILCDRVVALAIFSALSLFGVSVLHSLWLSLTAGSLAAAACGWILTPRAARPRLQLRKSTNPWASARHYGLANVAVSSQSLDMPILTAMAGPAAAGIYGAVSRWTQPMSLLANAFSTAAAPHMARAGSGAEAWQQVKRSVWMLAVAIGICCGMVAAAPFLVDVLMGDQFEQSIVVLQVLAIGMIPAIVNQPLFVFLQARGMDKPVSVMVGSTVLLQLLSVAVLSSSMGAFGAVIASALAQVILLIGLSGITFMNRMK